MSKRKKILVVDDEPDLREILADEFRYVEADVFEGVNGVNALEIYKQEKPDAVVSDIRMPGGDGVTLAKEIKALDPLNSRVFLITGFADLTAADAYHIGVSGFFTKPFHLEEVRESVLRSILPDEERWKKVPSELVKPIKADLHIKSNNWQQDFNSGGVALGRGGFFLPLNILETSSVSVRSGDWVRFFAGTELLGAGAIRWLRLDAKEKNQEVGYGIEFLELEPKFLQYVLDFKKNYSKAIYIPSSMTS